MQVGALEETVQVIGTAPTVDQTAATIGANFDTATLSRLPVGRRFSDTLYLAPGGSTGGNVGVANPSIEGSSGLDIGLNLSVSVDVQSGAPLTALAAHPVYDDGGEIPLTVRGAGFQTSNGFQTRTPCTKPVNAGASYNLKVAGRNLLLVPISGSACRTRASAAQACRVSSPVSSSSRHVRSESACGTSSEHRDASETGFRLRTAVFEARHRSRRTSPRQFATWR
jgi:hypothetical protein